jgi:hypothetical protein
MADDELIGALSVSHSRAPGYLGRDMRLLQRLAGHAAVAVANARLHEQLRTLSLTDPLTRLPNRRHMDIFLEREFAAAERGRASPSSSSTWTTSSATTTRPGTRPATPCSAASPRSSYGRPAP